LFEIKRKNLLRGAADDIVVVPHVVVGYNRQHQKIALQSSRKIKQTFNESISALAGDVVHDGLETI
jgi:hypothetical protein